MTGGWGWGLDDWGWDDLDPLDSTEVFDPSVGSWTAGARLPRRMNTLKATNIGDQVIIFGEGYFILDTNIITVS